MSLPGDDATAGRALPLAGIGWAGPFPPSRPSTYMELRHASSGRLALIVVPDRRFLAIRGAGPRTAADFQLATTILRATAIVLRARVARDRFDTGRIGVLECLWWHPAALPPDEIQQSFDDRSTWQWQQMIAVPATASDDDAVDAIHESRRRAGRAVELVRLVELREGPSAQILHIGGSASEGASVVTLLDAIAAAGFRPDGAFHELLVADERDVLLGRARTILRVPVVPAQALPST
ncbi:MAG TPA: hypothetical protein VFV72_03795 [Candidatus Limnocylindrales bacterium]|nr:hypothetical protein [Candidatus Limnocylindrales bacterium]